MRATDVCVYRMRKGRNFRSTDNATEFKCENKVLKITMTFGLINAKTDERIDIKEVIKQADEMLYKGKKSGKNTVVSANIPVTPPVGKS